MSQVCSTAEGCNIEGQGAEGDRVGAQAEGGQRGRFNRLSLFDSNERGIPVSNKHRRSKRAFNEISSFQPLSSEISAATERGWNHLNGLKDLHTETGSRKDQNLALTGLHTETGSRKDQNLSLTGLFVRQRWRAAFRGRVLGFGD